MSAAFPFLAIGLLLIILLIFLLIRSKGSGRSLSQSAEDQETLTDFQLEPFPQELNTRPSKGAYALSQSSRSEVCRA